MPLIFIAVIGKAQNLATDPSPMTAVSAIP
jgi:hypothetical protein